MSRRSGHRFADKDMRQYNDSGVANVMTLACPGLVSGVLWHEVPPRRSGARDARWPSAAANFAPPPRPDPCVGDSHVALSAPFGGPGSAPAPFLRCRSSVVEHSLGKGEVESSILSGSTIEKPMKSSVSHAFFKMRAAPTRPPTEAAYRFRLAYSAKIRSLSL
jgi:hypothetical protein